MATNYSLNVKEREQYKIQYSDLSPSLQAIIDGRIDLTELNKLAEAIETFKKWNNGMVVTSGTSFPTNPAPKNNKNLHLNLNNRVLYVYTSSSWKPMVMIPKQ